MKQLKWNMLILGCAIIALFAIGCMTTKTPNGDIVVSPADGVIDALQTAIEEATDAYALAQDIRERQELAARMGRLREELQRWKDIVK